jgi:hypothetical protein
MHIYYYSEVMQMHVIKIIQFKLNYIVNYLVNARKKESLS